MDNIYIIQKENFDNPFTIDEKYINDYYIYTINKNYEIKNYVENQSNIVGYIIYKNSINIIEIIEIAISKQNQKKGYANKLLSETLKKFKIDVYLEVEHNNYNAIKLYEKNNFKNIHIRKNYYGKFRDAIIMSRSIND